MLGTASIPQPRYERTSFLLIGSMRLRLGDSDTLPTCLFGTWIRCPGPQRQHQRWGRLTRAQGRENVVLTGCGGRAMWVHLFWLESSQRIPFSHNVRASLTVNIHRIEAFLDPLPSPQASDAPKPPAALVSLFSLRASYH